jgi:uncharacterized RDD family membrane protein YckC
LMERELDPSSFERTDLYFLKRFIAYLIDASIVLAIFLMIFVIAGIDLDILMILVIVILSGIIITLLKGAFEYSRKETPGKMVAGLRVESLKGELTFTEALVRNASTIVPVVLPTLDMLVGIFGSPDSRQKFLDNATTAMVVENMPIEVREIVRRPVQIEPVEKPEKIRLGFDQGYARGNCPRCGAPYRVLPPGDKRFDGLWNHRCTWCNALIQENL